MKTGILIGISLFFAVSCIREREWNGNCPDGLIFEMKGVPYRFNGNDVEGTRPYFTFTERLDLFAFRGERLDRFMVYGYEYCREHPEIPFLREPDDYIFLFVANLYDPKIFDWTFEGKKLTARFSISDHEEPAMLLVATNPVFYSSAERIPVGLTLLVSRLEVRLENPPSWVTGMEVEVNGIAETITNNYHLEDTTHIFKRIKINNTGPGIYWFGLNTFPTYPDKAAQVKIELVGMHTVCPFIIDDNRLHLNPGVITRLNLLFDANEEVTVSVEIDGKWEIVDEGQIII